MRLHGWTSYSLTVFMREDEPGRGTFQALIRRDGTDDGWSGDGSTPKAAIDDAFESLMNP